MKIGIDITPTITDSAGIGYYTLNLLNELLKKDNKNEYVLFSYTRGNLNYNFDKYRIKIIKAKKPNLFWIYKVVRYLNSNSFDLFISPSTFTFGILFRNTVQMVHDLAPIKHPEFFYRSSSIKYKLQLKLCTMRARALCTTTETIKNELIRFSKAADGKTYRIGMGINNWAKNRPTEKKIEQVKKKYDLPQNFFLSVNTLQPRKNYRNTIKAFHEFYKGHKNYGYIIVGKKGWLYNSIFSLVKELKLEGNVKFLGYTPEEDIPAIYTLCKGFIYMSFYEGFGMPLLEAYSYGKPILSSDIPVFREVMKENSLFADPTNVHSIASGMKELSKNYKKTVDDSFFRMYNWEDVTDKLLKIINLQ